MHENNDAAPNNNFCFDEDDFMYFRNNVNNATRHQGVYQEAWGKIKALEGTVVPCSSAKDGTVEWKVVEKGTKDDFAEV